jgi:hypothetical protein
VQSACPDSALSRREDLLQGGGTQDPLTPVQERLWVRRLDASHGVRGQGPKPQPQLPEGSVLDLHFGSRVCHTGILS